MRQQPSKKLLTLRSRVDIFQTSGQISLVGLGLSGLMTAFAFVTNQLWRFKAVGYTGFLLVLTAGLFALGPAFTARPKVLGAKPYQIVFDQYRSRVIVAVEPTLTPEDLGPTLRQVGNQVGTTGRRAGGSQLEIIARTLVTVAPGTSQVVYLGRLMVPLQGEGESTLTVNQEAFKEIARVAIKTKDDVAPESKG